MKGEQNIVCRIILTFYYLILWFCFSFLRKRIFLLAKKNKSEQNIIPFRWCKIWKQFYTLHIRKMYFWRYHLKFWDTKSCLQNYKPLFLRAIMVGREKIIMLLFLFFLLLGTNLPANHLFSLPSNHSLLNYLLQLSIPFPRNNFILITNFCLSWSMAFRRRLPVIWVTFK